MIASRSFPKQAYRACLGVLRLGNRYGADRLEKVCGIALEAGATRYQQVELILKNKVDVVFSSESSTTTTVPLHHDNIRGVPLDPLAVANLFGLCFSSQGLLTRIYG